MKRMLQDSFFIIEHFQKGENSGTVTVKLNNQHDVFSGHFPGQPVVPGVFTLQMVKECVQIALGKQLQYTELRNCKFTSPILPEDNQLILIEYEYDLNDPVGLKAIVKANSIVCLSLKANLIEQKCAGT